MDHPKASETFAPRFDTRNFGAYQYSSSGPATIAFTSSVRDGGHGDGSFGYDAQYNVVTYTYRPAALPPHATFGEVTDRRAEVLPGYWASTDETQDYKGTYGPFPAAGTVVVAYSDFRRFADEASALKAL